MTTDKATIENEDLKTISAEADKKSNLILKNLDHQINLKFDNDVIILEIPPEDETSDRQWQNLINDFQSRLNGMEKRWPPETKVNLLAQKRLLDNQKLQNLTDILEEVKLKLSVVITNRRQTAVAAASAGYSVQQESEVKPLLENTSTDKGQNLAHPLYLKSTIRSGMDVIHHGTVIVFGDVNPGGSILAGGDVFIWGSLRGMAHAGIFGDRQAIIMALKMIPTQIRIADLVARSPDNLPVDFDPEVAYISKQGIRITSALNFNKGNVFSSENKNWTDSKNKGLI